MNLRDIVNSAIQTVNPDIPITILKSNGYTIGTGARQVPAYLAPVTGFGQLQALDGNDLKQMDGLNIQGVIKALYVTGTTNAILRPNELGGDLIQIGGQNWLVVKMLEGWATWSKLAIVLQTDEPA
jgi:hypothetical protein